MHKRSVTIALFMILVFGACIQIDDPPNVPVISYSGHESGYCYDDLGNEAKCIRLTFRLEDGDGNFGLKENDTLPPFTDEYKHNFYYNLYLYNGEEFIIWNDLIINYFDIPYIEPQGQNKVLIADVSIDISFVAGTLPYDTLLIDFYVYDRELNQSNIAETDTIIFLNMIRR